MPTMEKQTQNVVYPANKQIVIDNTKDYVGRLLQDGSCSVNRPRRWSIGIQSKVF